MRSKNLMWGALALSVALVATGCSKPPQQEVDAVKATMSEADSAQAQTYAPDAYAKAQESMNAVNAEMEAQNAKFALFRSYGKTKELVAAAQTAAADAKTAAAAGKEQAKADAQAAIDAAKAQLAAAQTAMTELEACPRKPKGFSKDMDLMRGSWEGYNTQAAELDAAMGREDYAAARSAAETLKASADQLAADLASAKEKMKC